MPVTGECANTTNSRELARRGNDSQRSWRNRDLRWRLAHKLTISIEIERSLRLYHDPIGRGVLDLGREQMTSEINGWEQATKVERIHHRDAADVEFAIGEIRLGSDAHAVAIELRVSECGQQGELFGRNAISAVEMR